MARCVCKEAVLVYCISLCTCLGAYTTGYGIGSANGVQNLAGFLSTFNLISTDQSNITTNQSNITEDQCTESSMLSDESLLILGAMVAGINVGGGLGNLLAGKPNDYFGRKVAIVASGVIMVIGGAIQTASFFSWMFIAGRSTAGFGYGVFYAAGPVYIAEISPPSIRGRVSSLIGPTIGFGILTGYVANLLLSRLEFGWRVAQSLLCVFGLVFTVAVLFVPRSPRWLILKNREEEARTVLTKVFQRDENSVDEDIKNIKSTLPSTRQGVAVECRILFKWTNLKRIILGFLLFVLASASGNYVYFFSEILFCSLGIVPFVTATVVGVLAFVGTILTTAFIDKIGRKVTLIVGGLLMALLNGIAATLILSFNLEQEDNVVVSYIVVCLVCLFVLVFTGSWYVVPYIVNAEIFPLEMRGISAAITSSSYFFTSGIVSQLFPYLFSVLRSYGVLYLVGCINVTAALYFWILFPETKGTTMEEVDGLFKR